MQISCFSSYLSPRILVSILPEAIITVMFVWWWFFFVTSTFSNFKEELCVFPYLFIPLLTLMWTYRYLFYSMSCNLIVYFVALNCSRFGYWKCLQVGSRVLNMPPLFFEHGFCFLYFPSLASSGQKHGYSPGVLDVCVIVEILGEKNEMLEKKMSGILLILWYAGSSFFFPVLWLEMRFSQSFAVSTLCVVLEFSLPSSFKTRKERRGKNDTHSHPPSTLQFYKDHYSSFDFSPQSACYCLLFRVLRSFLNVFCP